MEKVEVQIHEHPLLPITRFSLGWCNGCESFGYMYGGYRCNELGCEEAVFHKQCAESLPEINHSSHPDHPLKLILNDDDPSLCSWCGVSFYYGYFCLVCDFKLDLCCVKGPVPCLTLENSNLHEHPLKLFTGTKSDGSMDASWCKWCDDLISIAELCYKCDECELVFHMECTKFFQGANHTSHPQHPLKLFSCKASPGYADKNCLLCGMDFDRRLYHCDVCNFSICRQCMSNAPPVGVVSPTTHEHQLCLVPRRIDFTCNACGTHGDLSPYFCLQCNFMIHRECIDLPCVININRHDHRISYTRRLGHGEWKCGVCRKKVNGFYGAYSCSKCSNYVVHSRCATRIDVWDMVELEGIPEDPEETPFVVIDDNTIKHFSHDHNLHINNDGKVLHESRLCQACVFQICSESFYSCKQCKFILHEKCANLPRKKRHVCHNQPFTLDTNPKCRDALCALCCQWFTGFRYMSISYGLVCLDVRCGSISEPFVHESHPHPLYYYKALSKSYIARRRQGVRKLCYTPCGGRGVKELFSCDECDFSFNFKCALLPQKVMRHRYDDHPLFLSYGESSVDGEYWCEACEAKVDPKKWFYTCNDCGVILHTSCVVGDFSYLMPGSVIRGKGEVVPNNSICRPLCTVCNSRCKHPSVFQVSKAGVTGYRCSTKCLNKLYGHYIYS